MRTDGTTLAVIFHTERGPDKGTLVGHAFVSPTSPPVPRPFLQLPFRVDASFQQYLNFKTIPLPLHSITFFFLQNEWEN